MLSWASVQLPRSRETRTIGTSVPWYAATYSRLMTIPPPPILMELMPTKVVLYLLLSFHVFLTHKHAMSQVHRKALSPPWQTKYGDGRAKRQEACPSCHAFLDGLYALQASFHRASAGFPSQGWCRERARETNEGPHAYEATRCHFVNVVSLSPMCNM